MAVTNLFTVDTMAEQVASELSNVTYVAGGTIPARLATQVRLAASSLWNHRDWFFRRKVGTLTIAADAAVAALAADFGKIDYQKMRNGDSGTFLNLTDSVRQFQAFSDRFESTTTGMPRYGLVGTDVSEAAFTWEVKVFPIADKEYTFSYWYVAVDPFHADPTLNDTTALTWPHPFNEGWHLGCVWRAQRFWRADDAWKDSKRLYDDWLVDAVRDHHQALTDDNEPIFDGYGDTGVIGNDCYGYPYYPRFIQ